MKAKPKTKKPRFEVRYSALVLKSDGTRVLHGMFAEIESVLMYFNKLGISAYRIVRLEVLSGD